MNPSPPILLIFPFDLLAHYLRCLELAKHLRSRYTIFFQHSDRYDSFIHAAGFQTFQCRTFNAESVLAKVRLFDFSWINEEELEVLLNDQIRVIKKFKPQAVLGDTAPTLKMAAEITETFYISLMNGYISRYYAKTRELPTSHPLHKYLRFLPLKILNPLTRIGESTKFYQIHHSFKALRRRYHLSKQWLYRDELEGNLNLICDLPELFPQKRLPEHYRWLFPLYPQNRSPMPGDWFCRLDRKKRTICVSMGSSGDWGQVSFLNHTFFEKFNIILAGDTQGTVIRSTVSFDFINLTEIFPYSDLVLCHGGNGTMYQALAYGIPVFSLTSHLEQEWNARAVENAGLGRWLNGLSADLIFPLVDEWSKKKNKGPLLSIRLKLHELEKDRHIEKEMCHFPALVK